MTDADRTASPYRIQSVYDAFGILETLVAANQPLTASQIAAINSDSRNRSFRLLKTMEECGYVLLEPSNHTYQPTLKLITLGQAVARNQTMELVARDIMENLREKTGETVYLTTREGDESVSLLTIESMHMMRICSQPGQRWLLGRGAVGQALLVSAPEDVKTQFLNRHPDIAQYWHQVCAQFDRDGVTYVDGREGTISDDGVMAIGVPIRDAQGIANHALGIAWPISRSTTEYCSLRAALLDSAQQLEHEVGLSTTREFASV